MARRRQLRLPGRLERPGHGLGGGLDIGYGVRDWLDVVASADVSYHPSSKIVLPTFTAGVRFAFDVLQVVPHIGVLAGVADQAITRAARPACRATLARFDVAIPLGVDYKLSRSFTIGVGGGSSSCWGTDRRRRCWARSRGRSTCGGY